MNNMLISIGRTVDLLNSRFYLKYFTEKNSLLVFNFHGLFCDEKEKNLNLLDPRLCITLENFRSFVEYYSNHDYFFITPDDILNGLDEDMKYILITFDDGYFNNKHVLPILREFEISSVFFISTDNVKHNKCFWWDVVYREGSKHDMRLKDIDRICRQLKSKTAKEIDKCLKNLFGDGIFTPKCDIDRPFTPSELKDFSKEEFVFLGNHTSDHNILTNYSPEEIKSNILHAQNTLHDITGITPIAIAYPNGYYSKEVIRIAKEIGLQLGFACEFKKNYFPIDRRSNGYHRLNRFDFYGYCTRKEIIDRCETFRSDIVISNSLIRNPLKVIRRF